MKPGSEAVRRVCAWCGDEIEPGEPEASAEDGRSPGCSHGLCSCCARELRRGERQARRRRTGDDG